MEWSLTWPIMTTLCSLWKISYIFLQKKKKLAHFPGPSLKSKKKTKRKSPKNKTKKYKPKPPLKTWKKCIYISGWRLTADGWPLSKPKPKNQKKPSWQSFLHFHKKFFEKMILYRRKKVSYICLRTKSIVYYF